MNSKKTQLFNLFEFIAPGPQAGSDIKFTLSPIKGWVVLKGEIKTY